MVVKEIVTVHIGQAGCQIGEKVWEQMCTEHGIGANGQRNVEKDTHGTLGDNWHGNDNEFETFFSMTGKMQHVPRAVFADTDPRSRYSILKGPLHQLFHPNDVLAWKQDCRNNYFEGTLMCREFHADTSILDRIRLSVERCDNLQGFFVFHAYGGGTGSGLGSMLLSRMDDDYTKVKIFEPTIYPSKRMATCQVEPYNAVLAINDTFEHVDLSMCFDNEKAYSICEQTLHISNPSFLHVNRLVGHFVSMCTSPLRFESDLNATLQDMVTNLVPTPEYKYAVLALSPLRPSKSISHEHFNLHETVGELFDDANYLCNVGEAGVLRKNRYMSAVVVLRGKQQRDLRKESSSHDSRMAINHHEALQCLTSMGQSAQGHRPGVKFVHYHKQPNYKVGILGQKPCLKMEPSFMAPGEVDLMAQSNRQGMLLGNTTAIRNMFVRQLEKFLKLWFHKAYLWQFIEAGGDEDTFVQAKERVRGIIDSYEFALRDCVEAEERETGQNLNLVGRTSAAFRETYTRS